MQRMEKEQNHSWPGGFGDCRGLTLVELLVATVVLLLLAGAIMSTMFRTQQAHESQSDLMEASQVARIAMNQIQAFLRQAGNDPLETALGAAAPVTTDNANQITIRSDVTGAVPGATPLDATGEPDGTLNNLHEVVTLRYDPVADRLYITPYTGGPEHLLAENILLFSWTFFDLQGNAAASDNDITRVHLTMVVQSSAPDLQTGNFNTVSLESDVMLRSRSYSLFSY